MAALSKQEPYRSPRCRLYLAVGDKRLDVPIAQARISLVEADRSPVRSPSKVDELLQVLCARGRRRILGEFEDDVEDMADVLGEVADVVVERAVVHGEEAQLLVLEGHELREM